MDASSVLAFMNAFMTCRAFCRACTAPGVILTDTPGSKLLCASIIQSPPFMYPTEHAEFVIGAFLVHPLAVNRHDGLVCWSSFLAFGFLNPVATFWQATRPTWQSCAVAPATSTMTTAILAVSMVGWQVGWASCHPWDVCIELDLFSCGIAVGYCYRSEGQREED